MNHLIFSYLLFFHQYSSVHLFGGQLHETYEFQGDPPPVYGLVKFAVGEYGAVGQGVGRTPRLCAGGAAIGQPAECSLSKQ